MNHLDLFKESTDEFDDSNDLSRTSDDDIDYDPDETQESEETENDLSDSEIYPSQIPSEIVYHKPRDPLFCYELKEFLEERRKSLIKSNLISYDPFKDETLDSGANNSDLQLLNIPYKEIYNSFPYNLCEYLKYKYYDGQDVKVIADFSELYLHNIEAIKVDFSEILFSKSNFQMCNFESCSFRDCDLSEVYFFDTNLKNADFRGADLSNIRFLGYEKKLKELSPENNNTTTTSNYENGSLSKPIYNKDFLENSNYYIPKLTNIILGSSRYLLNSSLERNKLIKGLFIKSEEDDIREQISEITKEMKNNLDNSLTSSLKDLEAQLSELAGIKDSENVTSFADKKIPYHTPPSLKNLLISDPIFDPFYLINQATGSITAVETLDLIADDSTRKKSIKIVPIKLTRLDIENYLKIDKDLPINSYAKKLAGKNNRKNSNSYIKFIADLSPFDLEEKFNDSQKQDFSSITFKDKDLSGTYFTGSNLSNCKFINCNLSNSIFDGAILTSTSFISSNLRGSSFNEVSMNLCYIFESDFSGVKMIGCTGEKILIESSNFAFADLKYSNLSESKMIRSKFSMSDLYGTKLIKSELEELQLDYSIIERSIFDTCTINKCNFHNAFAIKSRFKHCKIFESDFGNIIASGINMAGSEFNNNISFEGANLTYSNFCKIKGESINFSNSNMEAALIKEAYIPQVILEKANLKFADLSRSDINGGVANSVDISAALLDNIKANNLNLSQSTAQDISAKFGEFSFADFNGSNLSGSDFRGCILSGAILESSNLENAFFLSANLKNANINFANINLATNFKTSNLIGVTGKAFKAGNDGKKDSLDLSSLIKTITTIEKAENFSKSHILLSNIFFYFGSLFFKSGDFVQHPFKSYPRFFSLLISCILGVVIHQIIFSNSITLDYYVDNTKIANAILITSATTIGWFTGKKSANFIGITSIFLGILGLTHSSIIGGVVAVIGGICANHLAVYFINKSLDSYVSKILVRASKLFNRLSESFGLSKVEKSLLRERDEAIEYHVYIKRPSDLYDNQNSTREYDLLEIRKQNNYYWYKSNAMIN